MSESSTHDENGRFAKGNPGGPGRPRSIRHSATVLDQLGAEVGEQVFQVIVDKALAGDLRAAELLLSRVWPTRRGRPIEIEAARVKSLPDVVPAVADVMNAVLAGEMTPREGHDVSALLQTQYRTIETFDIERRLVELENKMDEDDEKQEVEGTFSGLYSVDRTTVFDKEG
jgi:hypothetical protein